MSSGVEVSNYLREHFKISKVAINTSSCVCGVGINDADYRVAPKLNGSRVKCPAYRAWENMLWRCYSEVHTSRKPTYKGVVVCSEWLYFMNFRDWWVNHHVDGYQLDKDILSHTRTYSPETCLYVPVHVNNLVILDWENKNGLPIGVFLDKERGKFRVETSTGVKGKVIKRFDCPLAAAEFWLEAKSNYIEFLRPEMDEIHPMLFDRVFSRVIDAYCKSLNSYIRSIS